MESSLADLDRRFGVDAGAIVLISPAGWVAGVRPFRAGDRTEPYLEAALSDGAIPTSVAVVRGPEQLQFTPAIVLRNERDPISHSAKSAAQAYVSNLAPQTIADLVDVESQLAAMQRQATIDRMWLFDRAFSVVAAYEPAQDEALRFMRPAVRRYCAVWNWDDMSTCSPGTFAPVPDMIASIAPARGSPGILAVVMLQAVRVRSLRSVMREYALTDREIEVLELVLLGMHASEIGEMLGIAESTVRDHLKHSIIKTNSRNRAQMISRLLGHAPFLSPRGRSV